jgi:two-component system cell cycle sensor histidine kinase/response regulator CckA
MAADFNASLTAVLAAVEDLYTRLSGEERDLATQIRQSASRAANLTGQLWALSRPDPSPVEVIDVNQAIGDSVDSLSLCLGQGITLETELRPRAGFLQADRHRFQQMLINLALYARDAMPHGGTLRIETDILDLDAAEPAARRYHNQWFVRLRFIDSGSTPDATALSSIFEPRSGSFGLAIVHSVVVQGGGRIAASRGAERGTSFEILWPCIGTHQGVAGLIGRYRPNDPVPAILLVEEEDAVRRAMWCCLEQEGYRVLEASTARHAELMASAYRQPISVLVACSEDAPLADRLKIPATLCLSGYRHDEIPDAGVLPKPFPMAEFRRRIRALVAS